MTAELLLTHAETHVESRISDADILAGEIVTTEAVRDGRVERSETRLGVTVEQVLGAARKPIPAGRHRAAVLFDGVVVTQGVVTNEGAAHGRPYDALRRWSLSVRDMALDEVAERLDAIRLLDLDVQAAEVRVEARLTTGTDAEVYSVPMLRLGTLVDLACEAAGVAVERPAPFVATEFFGAMAREVEPDIVVGAPRPWMDRRPPPAASSVPDWSAWELVEAWAATEPLAVGARYAPYPSDDLVLVLVPGYRWPLGGGVEPIRPALDAEAEEWDWDTDPGADLDGEPLDDVAIHYADPRPRASDYASTRWAIRALPSPGREESEVSNATVLALPWRIEAAASALHDIPSPSGTVGLARLEMDVADEDDVVVLASVAYAHADADSPGRLYAVVERRIEEPPEGAPDVWGELWASHLWPQHAMRLGDVERATVSVHTSALPPDLRLMDLARGVALDGQDWAVEEVATNHDLQRADLSLVRPAATLLAAGAPAAAAPQLDAILTGHGWRRDSEDQEGNALYAWSAEWTWTLPPESATPARFDLQLPVEPNAFPTLADLPRSGTYRLDADGLPPDAPLTLRVRAVYPTRATAWQSVTIDTYT